jgi:hypothetical protein
VRWAPGHVAIRLTLRESPVGFRATSRRCRAGNVRQVHRQSALQARQRGQRTSTRASSPTQRSTEPIGSVPRPARLIQAAQDLLAGTMSASDYDAVLDASLRDTIEQFEATGSPVITDGEQGKPSFSMGTMSARPSPSRSKSTRDSTRAYDVGGVN